MLAVMLRQVGGPQDSIYWEGSVSDQECGSVSGASSESLSFFLRGWWGPWDVAWERIRDQNHAAFFKFQQEALPHAVPRQDPRPSSVLLFASPFVQPGVYFNRLIPKQSWERADCHKRCNHLCRSYIFTETRAVPPCCIYSAKTQSSKWRRQTGAVNRTFEAGAPARP